MQALFSCCNPNKRLVILLYWSLLAFSEIVEAEKFVMRSYSQREHDMARTNLNPIPDNLEFIADS